MHSPQLTQEKFLANNGIANVGPIHTLRSCGLLSRALVFLVSAALADSLAARRSSKSMGGKKFLFLSSRDDPTKVIVMGLCRVATVGAAAPDRARNTMFTQTHGKQKKITRIAPGMYAKKNGFVDPDCFPCVGAPVFHPSCLL